MAIGHTFFLVSRSQKYHEQSNQTMGVPLPAVDIKGKTIGCSGKNERKRKTALLKDKTFQVYY